MEKKKDNYSELSPLKQAFLRLEEMEERLRAAERLRTEPVAVIGIGCRLPGGAVSPADYWKLLKNGVDAISEVPPDRWNIDDYYDPDPNTPGKMATRYGAFLEGVDRFDARCFGISPREAASMDPQQRVLLEVGWEALEHAAQAPDRLEGSQTGMYIGLCTNDYEIMRVRDPSANAIDLHYASGIAHSIVSGRLSYFLGTNGPSIVIDTACSSSLVAVHLACQSLRAGEIDMALAGGVNIIIVPETTIALSRAGMMSKDGRCKTFDDSADGFVRGEGCALVVLKRVSDALKHGDRILALISGSAINHDGASSGLTVPSGPAQEAVIRKALKNAGVDPLEVQYVECHGTGTSLGDPIEVQSLNSVYGKGRGAHAPLIIGSVKTNIGHLEAAAGIAGLIKVVLALNHGQIPPHLHLIRPNTHIAWQDMPVRIAAEVTTDWPQSEAGRGAAVSAFGFSGTNAHVVLQEPPGIAFSPTQIERPIHILGISAKSEAALKNLAERYACHLTEHSSVALTDICFTANTGRSHLEYRFSAVARTVEEVRRQLAAFMAQEKCSGATSGQVDNTDRPRTVFLFTGQGSQHMGMGRRLFDTQPTFRKVLERCDELLRPYLERPLLEVLYPETGQNSPLDQTGYTQPALFAVEYALAELWRSWGITPSVVMGHSVGEYVAACVAGLFSLEDGLKLIATRAGLMQALPSGGRMAAVFADEAKVAGVIAPYPSVSLACLNGPESVVISGAGPEVAAVLKHFQTEGIGFVPLTVSHAFHSPLMEPMLDDFEHRADEITYFSPHIPLVSNVTGRLARGEEMANGTYWRRHVRQPVQFSASMAWLYSEGYRTFMEIGPSPALLDMGARCLPKGDSVWLPSLKRGEDDWQRMLSSLAELYVRGECVDWEGFDRDYPRRKVDLPTYPFQRQRYWIKSESLQPGQTSRESFVQPLLECLTDWLYEVKWEQKPLTSDVSSRQQRLEDELGTWLIFTDRSGIGQKLAALLRDRGEICVVVSPGDAYEIMENGYCRLNPARDEHFLKLLHDARNIHNLPIRGVVHLWSLDADPPEQTSLSALESHIALNCGSALYIAQALAKFDIPPAAPLWLVTRGAQPVSDKTNVLSVAQAPLWGFGRTVAAEQPDIWGGLVDLDPFSAGDLSATLLAQTLISPKEEDQIAFRDGQCFVARLVRSDRIPVKTGSFQCRSDSTYLITGGLGGIGSVVARWLVKQGARWLITLERTKIPPRSEWNNVESGTILARKIGVLQELETLGAKVQSASVDVGDQSQLRIFLEGLEAQSWPSIRGVMHAAGITQYQSIAEHNVNAMKGIMHAKIMGGWLLHQFFKDTPLDFFVLFSSSSAVLSSPLVGSYAAANAFLDALAHYRRNIGLAALSINWGSWEKVGMATEFNTILGRSRLRGVESLSPELGVAVLEQLLLQGSTQNTVMFINWHEWSNCYPAYSRLSLFKHLVNPAKADNPDTAEECIEGKTPNSDLLEQLQETLPDRRKKLLLDHVCRHAAQVLGLIAWQPDDYRKPLRDLGLDSLMAVELRDRLGAAISRKLPATLLFDYPTIEEVTDYLATEMPSLFHAMVPRQASSEESTGSLDRLKDIEQLSEDEVSRLFEENLHGKV